MKIPIKQSIKEEMLPYFDSENKCILWLEEWGIIIGFIYGEIEKSSEYIKDYEKTGHIEGLYVEEAYRWCWWWSLLIETLLVWFKDNHISLIRLGVLSNNTEAMALYEKLGFSHFYSKMMKII